MVSSPSFCHYPCLLAHTLAILPPGVRTGKVHGGKAFGPRSDRDWSTDLPRKVRQLGLKVALSQKLREGRLRIVDEQGLVMDDWSEMYPRNEPLGQPVWAAAKTGFVRERIDGGQRLVSSVASSFLTNGSPSPQPSA